MILENYGHSVLPSAPPAMVEVMIIDDNGIELIGVCHYLPPPLFWLDLAKKEQRGTRFSVGDECPS